MKGEEVDRKLSERKALEEVEEKRHHYHVRSESPVLKFKRVIDQGRKFEVSSNCSSLSRRKENKRYQSFDEFECLETHNEVST
mmetsp:Transcript_25930/g.19549  ORF Transcript_25930/g.19549 Transcript_25930/m.19549 type:complete len:83 (+) Transcript_25930:362-610(+)|eukprot:CAMPEP_0202975902 /NCGR_PEP_ID=MMETSP1396-20130829/73113_1 /ASSEMBLY_ACC=CAM_ASM_000872 /TAXON_ID= /ORGANISM="Pseudokeronopsis sp., Strain Brazil" /LENGTH=82 /DNA_ID=CAMNT_0049712369 /DNA_START=171 /DNA_END=419 /DNA_ORIENTATION=+